MSRHLGLAGDAAVVMWEEDVLWALAARLVVTASQSFEMEASAALTPALEHIAEDGCR